MKKNHKAWSEYENNILKKKYGKILPNEFKKLLPYRTYEAIRTRAIKKLKISSINRQPYSKEEIDFLRKKYPTADKKLIVTTIQKTNPKKTWENIRAFCIRKDINRTKYLINPDERRKIIALYEKGGHTGKQISSIMNRGSKTVQGILKGLKRKKDCKICGRDISHKNNVSSMFCEGCMKERNRNSDKKYNATERARKSRLRYGRSDKGKFIFKVNTFKRRAKKRNQIYSLTKNDITKIYQRDKNKCVYCGDSDKTKGNIHLDHIVPVSKGGDWSVINMVVSCRSCNVRKKDNDVLKWLKEERMFIPHIILNLLEKQKEQEKLITESRT